MKIFLETEEDLEKYVSSNNFKNEEVIVNGNALTNVINSYKNRMEELVIDRLPSEEIVILNKNEEFVPLIDYVTLNMILEEYKKTSDEGKAFKDISTLLLDSLKENF